ncbi:hypothetical protein Tco_1550214, partial [Tanacetum coccineum]
LEVTYFANLFFFMTELAYMDRWLKDGSVDVLVAYGLRLECQLRVVLFFPYLGFFSPSFSWKGFLRRQSQLAYNTPNVQHLVSLGDMFFVKWYFPVGVLVTVFT